MARRPTTRRSSDSRRYYDWLARAGEDIIASGLLMTDDNCYHSAAFHCQQCIEKALKAYLLLMDRRLVDGHNLTWLCKQAMRYDQRFSSWLDESAALNRCYIETRYPADLPFHLEYKQVNRFYKMAKDMYLFICTEVDKEVEAHAEEADEDEA
ncbi:MAG: HEPN domain-containing protein [Oscillospiraceae bacterium]